MRWLLSVVLLGLASLPIPAQGQQKRSEEDFVKSRPAVGELLPELTVYDSAGKEVKTSRLRGHYTVLTFGCLT